MPQPRTSTVNCPMIGGDRLFTRPRSNFPVPGRGRQGPDSALSSHHAWRPRTRTVAPFRPSLPGPASGRGRAKREQNYGVCRPRSGRAVVLAGRWNRIGRGSSARSAASQRCQRPESTGGLRRFECGGSIRSVKSLRLDISFSQGDEWKALISKYIGIIPVSGDVGAAAEQRISVWPPKTHVSRAMIAKVGAAPRHSQSVARRAVASPTERIAATPHPPG